MKIYLVTMQAIGDYWIGERMKFMALEKDLNGEPHPDRPGHLNRDKDVTEVDTWRTKMKARKDLLDRLGILIPAKGGESEETCERKAVAHLNNPTFVCTGSQLLEILEVDDSITVKSSTPVSSDTHEGILARLDHVTKKLENLNIPDSIEQPAHIYNEHCEVHVPGNLLATYNESLLLEDSCTDALQDALNNGWRIIAVCPQSQRRPDYILGRYNPEIYTNGKGADRKP